MYSGVRPSLGRFVARTMFFLFAFFCFTSFALAIADKDKDKSKTQKSNPDVTVDNDSADIPPFAQGKIDPETYLRLRAEHVRARRGLDSPNFDPRARVNAIKDLEKREKVLDLLNKARQKRKSEAEQSNNDSDLSNPAGSDPSGSNPSNPSPPPPMPAWFPVGPAPIPNGQTDPNFNLALELAVSGRVTCIAIHPLNANIVYVGTAQGGVYRSLDGGGTWTAIFDNAASLAIGAIAIAPSQPTTIFVGTGEANLSADSYFGVGVYRIDNSEGTSPVLNGPLNLDQNGLDVFTGRSINKIIVKADDPNQILVASSTGIGGVSGSGRAVSADANAGVYRSQNAMSASPTFIQQTVFTIAPPVSRRVSDLIADPGNNNVVLASVFGAAAVNDGGVFRTTNAWAPNATWVQTLLISQTNIKFAINSVGGVTTVYVGAGGQGSGSDLNGRLRRSTDGGQTWSAVIAGGNNFCNGQCFYDIALDVDPNNANILYLGGSSGSNILRKSTNAAQATPTFASISGTFLHADTHAVAIAPSNPSTIYFGSDGGIFKSTNAGASWFSINTAGFNATQFESVATHPTDRNFSIGGTQDNGTPFEKPDGSWFRADFGDGGFALIDQNATDTSNVTMYHTYFNQTNNLLALARVTDSANAVEGNWAALGCGGTANGIGCADAVLFYAPLALGPGNPNTVYYASDRLYRSSNQASTMTVVSQAPILSGRPIAAIGISPQNDNVRIVGLNAGANNVWATTTGSSALVNVTGSIPAVYVSRAVIDPNNAQVAYVTLSAFGLASGAHVWKTTNLGSSPFVASGSGIPDIPVNGFVVDPMNSNNLYAGTDIGVYNSLDGGATWNPYGTGLPRVAVFDMSIQNSNRILRIATHGRGLWESTIPVLDQTITFAAIPNHLTTDAPFTVSASASSGLPLTYSIVSGPATISGNTITLTRATGTVVVQASQAGNAAFNPASATTSFAVGSPAAQIVIGAVVTNTGGGYVANLTIRNTGNVTANNVTLTTAQLGTASGTPLPQSMGTLNSFGGTITTTVNFPASVGNPGQMVAGKFTVTSSIGTFSGAVKIVLPQPPLQ